MKPDLHMHTTSSDGVLSPRELVRYAAGRGVTLMAITDHDSLNGVDSLRGAATEIPVLTGTELSLNDMKGLHLLGYGLGQALELRSVLHELADRRLERARLMLQRLAALGMPMDYDELCTNCGGTVGRMHIARAMVAHGYVREPQEAFAKWIGNDGPAYVEGERLSMAEALPLLHRNGFVPVLAHPAELNKDDMTLRVLLERWQELGLMGVEVYHPSQQKRSYRLLDAMARRMGFLITGGSDFHSDVDRRHGQPGCTCASWSTAEEDVNELLAALQCAAGMS